MSGKSSKTAVITVRLPIEALEHIKRICSTPYTLYPRTPSQWIRDRVIADLKRGQHKPKLVKLRTT